MRAPPPVEFASAPGRAWRAALALLAGAAVAVPLAWALPSLAAAGFEAPGDPLAQGGLATGAAVAAAAAFWLAGRRAAASERMLRWDGQDWVLAGDGRGRPDQRGAAVLALDLGSWMLVRFLPASGSGTGGARPLSRWLPLAMAGDPARWAALRGALWNWRGGVRP